MTHYLLQIKQNENEHRPKSVLTVIVPFLATVIQPRRGQIPKTLAMVINHFERCCYLMGWAFFLMYTKANYICIDGSDGLLSSYK